MAYHEIDSFVNKFKALCQGGRNASLTMSSKAGKAVINLRVDLGVLPQQDLQPHHPPKHPRYGPAQQRRRERRAAARQAAAEQAEAVLTPEEKDVLDMADIAKQDAEIATDSINAKENETEKVTNHEAAKTSVDDVQDGVVPDYEYNLDDSKTVENQVEEPPPPVRDRTLGGIDYYLLSYDDPIFDNGYD